jgi:DNA-binding NtrC family response regulator
MEELKRHAIVEALRETGGDKIAAAVLLGIGRPMLHRKLKASSSLAS